MLFDFLEHWLSYFEILSCIFVKSYGIARSKLGKTEFFFAEIYFFLNKWLILFLFFQYFLESLIDALEADKICKLKVFEFCWS